jgi:hypothetical protein
MYICTASLEHHPDVQTPSSGPHFPNGGTVEFKKIFSSVQTPSLSRKTFCQFLFSASYARVFSLRANDSFSGMMLEIFAPRLSFVSERILNFEWSIM